MIAIASTVVILFHWRTGIVQKLVVLILGNCDSYSHHRKIHNRQRNRVRNSATNRRCEWTLIVLDMKYICYAPNWKSKCICYNDTWALSFWKRAYHKALDHLLGEVLWQSIFWLEKEKRRRWTNTCFMYTTLPRKETNDDKRGFLRWHLKKLLTISNWMVLLF